MGETALSEAKRLIREADAVGTLVGRPWREREPFERQRSGNVIEWVREDLFGGVLVEVYTADFVDWWTWTTGRRFGEEGSAPTREEAMAAADLFLGNEGVVLVDDVRGDVVPDSRVDALCADPPATLRVLDQVVAALANPVVGAPVVVDPFRPFRLERVGGGDGWESAEERVTHDEDGLLDEVVVLRPDFFHLERMRDDSVWIGITRGDRTMHINLWSVPRDKRHPRRKTILHGLVDDEL